MTYILSFSGRKQSGKSTSADYIISLITQTDIKIRENRHELNMSCKIYSFADPLKQDICINILGLTYDQCYGSDDDKNTMTDLWWDGVQLTAREAMEIIGTKIFRALKTNVWADATINKIKKENVDLAIISDCRFPNEVEAVKNSGGINIRLDLDPFHSNSISENSLDQDVYDWSNFDIIIKNSKMTIEEKNKEILRFLYDYNILSTCGLSDDKIRQYQNKGILSL